MEHISFQTNSLIFHKPFPNGTYPIVPFLSLFCIYSIKVTNEKFSFIDRNKYKKIEKLYKFIIPNWEF